MVCDQWLAILLMKLKFDHLNYFKNILRASLQHSLTTKIKTAQLPDLLTGWPFWKAIALKKSCSVFIDPFLIALGMLLGKSGWSTILLCRLSFKYSAHLCPPCPSKTPNIYIFGQSATLGYFYGGCTTFKIIAILSSFAFLTVPTFVFAAKLLTVPNDLVLNLDY